MCVVRSKVVPMEEDKLAATADDSTGIEGKNAFYYKKMMEEAARYPTMRGLHNLGNTCTAQPSSNLP